jgi:septum formation protein
VSAYTVILASASPRRLELLQKVGITPVIQPADIDETPHPDEHPIAFAARMAQEKAYSIALTAVEKREFPHPFAVIAADTVVDCGGEIFGKPTDTDDARRMLRALSGRTHEVHTAVVVVAGTGEAFSDVVTSRVTFAPLSDHRLEWYLATGEPCDKAGAYAIQGAGGVLVESVQGSLSNVVGLPLAQTMDLLARAGHVVG